MSGLLLFFLLVVPRVGVVLMYLSTHLIQRALPANGFAYAGFLFLPITTMAYAGMVNTGQPVAGVAGILTLVITITADVGTLANVVLHRRSY